MNPIKKLKMEDALVPESQKDAAYYWALTKKFNDIAARYNRQTIFFCMGTAALLAVSILLSVLRVLVVGGP